MNYDIIKNCIYRVKINDKWKTGQLFWRDKTLLLLNGFGYIDDNDLYIKAQEIIDTTTLCKQVPALFDLTDITSDENIVTTLYEHDIIGMYNEKTDLWFYGEIVKMENIDANFMDEWIFDCTQCNGKQYNLMDFLKKYTIDRYIGNSFDINKNDRFFKIQQKIETDFHF